MKPYLICLAFGIGAALLIPRVLSLMALIELRFLGRMSRSSELLYSIRYIVSFGIVVLSAKTLSQVIIATTPLLLVCEFVSALIIPGIVCGAWISRVRTLESDSSDGISVVNALPRNLVECISRDYGFQLLRASGRFLVGILILAACFSLAYYLARE